MIAAKNYLKETGGHRQRDEILMSSPSKRSLVRKKKNTKPELSV